MPQPGPEASRLRIKSCVSWSTAAGNNDENEYAEKDNGKFPEVHSLLLIKKLFLKYFFSHAMFILQGIYGVKKKAKAEHTEWVKKYAQ
jgi:hypothetical protein